MRSFTARMQGVFERVCGNVERGTVRLACEGGNGPSYGAPDIKQDPEFRSLKNEEPLIIQSAKDRAVFTLNTIRTESKDPNTKAITCTANLNVKVGDGNAQREINYKVEITTDKKLYATVYGLQ